ncbi:MAG TPA: aminomethyl-transferring glycine dehydrogenase subunit GcvPB [Spirochaetota bacterium]|nr:aminomethyl-transferring glycine dehydrogenase subunit GcvPB [Spirochaetota bacterium]
MKDSNLIFEKGRDSVSSYSFKLDKSEKDIEKYLPQNILGNDISFMPNISEGEVLRHFIRLSDRNYGVDSGFYPLGSCTMKYNPKINERVTKNPDFNMHPYSDNARVQGNLELIYKCKEALVKITGMDDMSLAPSAGAHGELSGLYIIKAYFKYKKEDRPIILVPDSAHGTNPASANVAGFKVISVKSDAEGFVDIEDLKSKTNTQVAAFMLTNPNTLGLFEKNISEIVKICHALDIQLYYDGANLNAIFGLSSPGKMGFDVVHLNLHKSFATPHGGGGPGAGPVGVKKHLKDFLPNEEVVLKDKYYISKRGELSIGKVRSFYMNFFVVMKAYVYIVAMGKEGFDNVGLMALLNANYLAALLKNDFDIETKNHIMHEFVISLTKQCEESHITIMDFAKRILDYGYHSPTVSFPLIVHDCLMIEPTETESKETLEKFAEIMKKIMEEAKKNPDSLKNSPVNTPIKRIDDVAAARNPVLKYSGE